MVSDIYHFQHFEWRTVNIQTREHALRLFNINENSLFSEIDEIHYLTKLRNTTVSTLSETEHDSIAFTSEVKLNLYDFVRSDRNPCQDIGAKSDYALNIKILSQSCEAFWSF